MTSDLKYDLSLNISCQTLSDLFEASLFELKYGNKLRNTNFKLMEIVCYFSVKEYIVRLKCAPFFGIFVFFDIFKETVLN